ncbi:MAG: aminotransferase class I/II-fold pyridoxal phosphate-dependent enzyme [bacterium]
MEIMKIPTYDLSLGDPDFAAPEEAVRKLQEQVEIKENHRYALGNGLLLLREAIAQWYHKRFNIILDPQSEITPLLGSKEGIIHLMIILVEEDEIVILPEIAHPMYHAGVILSGGQQYLMPLDKHFQPCPEDIPHDVARKAKLMILNYPHNPTGALIRKDRLETCLEFAREHNLIICYDNVYSEITFVRERISPLQFNDTKEFCVEFHSLSKSYSMTGWRLGFIVGNQEIILGLQRVKAYIDDGIFLPIQYAGAEVLLRCDDYIEKHLDIYNKRRNLVNDRLRRMGIDFFESEGGFYIWAKVPMGFSSSREFSQVLLKEAGIVVVPGNAFGEKGEGYFRMSFLLEEKYLNETMNRFEAFMKKRTESCS